MMSLRAGASLSTSSAAEYGSTVPRGDAIDELVHFARPTRAIRSAASDVPPRIARSCASRALAPARVDASAPDRGIDRCAR